MPYVPDAPCIHIMCRCMHLSCTLKNVWHFSRNLEEIALVSGTLKNPFLPSFPSPVVDTHTPPGDVPTDHGIVGPAGVPSAKLRQVGPALLFCPECHHAVATLKPNWNLDRIFWTKSAVSWRVIRRIIHLPAPSQMRGSTWSSIYNL